MVYLLLGVLFLLLWGTLNGIIQAKTIIDSKGQAMRTGRYLIERMSREIASSMEEPVSQVINKKVAGSLSSSWMRGENGHGSTRDSSLGAVANTTRKTTTSNPRPTTSNTN